MFKAEYLIPASEDVEEIHQYYEEQKFGLGDEFLNELDVRIASIASNPNQCQVKFRAVRKAFTERFPYAIYYKVVSTDLIIIYAVLHMSRHSKLWKKRVNSIKQSK